MKNLKSLLVAGAMVVAGSAMAQDYNRVGLSYNYDHYRYNKNFYGNDKDRDPSFSSNGVGLNYIHGFRLTRSLPMYIEVGGNLNFGFREESGMILQNGHSVKGKEQFQNLNLTVPVNFAWKFNLGKEFYITPYYGVSFKVNFITRERIGIINGKTIWSDWVNLLKEDENIGMIKGYTWRTFQMGTHLGATFGWKHVSLGLQYGGDFIPAYSVIVKKGEFSTRYAVDTTNFKLTLGYEF
ncbi:MAG: hypothetical protein K2M93_03330 [Muribaculaceae bacterium]|nr:hypothetical protein [Muribaculaceae bacterium]